ncbi:hypothetical protein Q8F55_003540 [Vanrija albida]|uniref:BTB domain-containing protein n=1 Tax=Vanrija albida TaxID=181172 RepID=A0ABR3Q494_9TREE
MATPTATSTPSVSARPSAPASVVVSQPPTVNGDAESSKDAGAEAAATFASGMAEHIFNNGFCHQQWADIQVVFFSGSLKLHRLILARSPYLAHLMSNSMPGSTIQLSFTDENITEEAAYIAIQHLYHPSTHIVTPENARSVLAAAYLFGGMPELVQHAYSVASESISASNVVDYVHWLDAGSRRPAANGFAFGSVGAPAPAPPSGVWADPATAPYGEWSARLRSDVLTFLIRTLPAQLHASGGEGTLATDARLLAAYAPLPFDLFKHCVEAPELPIPFMQDRFSFAKRAIAQRKKSATTAAARGPPQAQYEETVVLALKSEGDGMAVHITRKPKRGRAALWKVEG